MAEVTKSSDIPDSKLLAEVCALHPTTSARIRALAAAGWPRAVIARALNKRYQHVRNVLVDQNRRLGATPKSIAASVEPDTAPTTAAAPNWDYQRLHEVLTKARSARSTKRPVNVSVNEDLLEAARALNINFSETLEDAVREIILHETRARWLAENREAIEAHNRFVERYGLWSDGLRQF